LNNGSNKLFSSLLWAFIKKENWFIPEKLERVLIKNAEDLMKKFKTTRHKIRSVYFDTGYQ